MPTTIELARLYEATGTAKLSDVCFYEARVRSLVPAGGEVILTGQAPVWLYLRMAHALHGRAKKLFYDSPVTGIVEIFNHDPH
jgi:hypothetical protein